MTRYSTAVGLLLYRERELRKSSSNRYPSKIGKLVSKITKKLSNYFQKEL